MHELDTCEHGELLRMCEVCQVAGVLRKLRAELAEYKVDAERYRWLKSLSDVEIFKDHTTWTLPDGSTFRGSIVLRGENTQFGPGPTMDDVIDAARKGEGEKG